MKVSRETIARRLATRPSVIDDFEAGALAALPHPKETERIVRTYCELIRLDPEPLLWRIRSQMQAWYSYNRHPAQAAPPRRQPAPPAQPRAVAQAEQPRTGPARRRRRGARALFALSAPVALVALAALLARTAPEPAYRAVGLLPSGASGPARAGLDALLLLMAPRRDGLKWVEISDPQLRKADRLQSDAR
jgi:hypothetical protein